MTAHAGTAIPGLPSSRKGRNGQGGQGGQRGQRGLTLFEVLVAMVLLGAAMLALSAAAGSSMRRASLSRSDMDMWASVTRVVDSLTAEGWGAVTAGSRTKTTHTIAWTVTAENADLDRVDVLVGRRMASGYGSIQDTLTLYLANPQP